MFLISTLPNVSPLQIARGVKGRLQTLVREHRPNALQRNYDLHSTGSTKREKVEHYVAGQLQHHADDNVSVDSHNLADLQIINPEVDLGRYRLTSHARYHCNLHVVLRLRQNWVGCDESGLARIRNAVRLTAQKYGHLLSRLGLLKDHLHLVLGSGVKQSPLDVVLPYMNNIAWQFGMRNVLWSSCFVGTIGEYDLGAIRRAEA